MTKVFYLTGGKCFLPCQLMMATCQLRTMPKFNISWQFAVWFALTAILPDITSMDTARQGKALVLTRDSDCQLPVRLSYHNLWFVVKLPFTFSLSNRSLLILNKADHLLLIMWCQLLPALVSGFNLCFSDNWVELFRYMYRSRVQVRWRGREVQKVFT